MLIHRGASAVMSLPTESVLAETFVPRVVIMKEKAAKKAAARLSHLSMSCITSQLCTYTSKSVEAISEA